MIEVARLLCDFPRLLGAFMCNLPYRANLILDWSSCQRFVLLHVAWLYLLSVSETLVDNLVQRLLFLLQFAQVAMRKLLLFFSYHALVLLCEELLHPRNALEYLSALLSVRWNHASLVGLTRLLNSCWTDMRIMHPRFTEHFLDLWSESQFFFTSSLVFRLLSFNLIVLFLSPWLVPIVHIGASIYSRTVPCPWCNLFTHMANACVRGGQITLIVIECLVEVRPEWTFFELSGFFTLNRLNKSFRGRLPRGVQRSSWISLLLLLGD